MNKYHEALDYLKGVNLFGGLSNVALECIEELVDKATPMKVIRIPTKHNVIIYQCPKCLVGLLYTNFNKSYCGECGQALDWRE